MPNGVCRLHGGLTPSGIGSPNFKTGKYSKCLPDRMAANYAAALADPHLLEVTAELALTEARLNDLLQRVDTGEAGAIWRNLRQAWEAGEKARCTWEAFGASDRGVQAKAEFFAAWASMGAFMVDGAFDYQAWDEIGKQVEQKRKLSETETKRVKQARESITRAEAMVLVGAVCGIVHKHVHDREALAAISADLKAIMSSGTGSAMASPVN